MNTSAPGAAAARLREAAAQLGVPLDSQQLTQLATLASELLRWNKAYNLTAITDPDEVLTHHLLDSLSVQQDLAGELIADVGTGAGFPGLPLAIVNPARRFTLIDAVDKKLRFIDHAARTLQLTNVVTQHVRVEQLQPPQAFDTVMARAFAPLPRMVQLVAPLCDAHTTVLAMVGRWPPPESEAAQFALPVDWRIVADRPIQVPGLAAERHVLRLQRV
ncbi:MAG TPA: 16S rRNA (guanine(527)-N(7))-methyltransferase RsmG [Steroidobacteraceae bacterium]|nr:16S rRNA (guanine(527)-N(7))-methyltransferase RsmG [Steroidobacteraceae bacterium]